MSERFALGFGNNIDYEIVWDSAAVEALVTAYGIRAGELDVNRPIESERDLVISILSFLQTGTGGERFVARSEIVERFSEKFEKKITLGGTSVRAALVLEKLGYTSALHLATLNDDVRRLIPQSSRYVCSNTRDTTYPHLIVQFGAGARVQANDIDLRAPHANRLIYHCDEDNIVMALNESFSELITNAKVLLVSGFNAMHDEALLAERLESVGRIMQALPGDALVFYEDAGFYDANLSRRIIRTLAQKIDVYSLNEDELQGYLGRTVDMLDVTQIQTALQELHQHIPVPLLVVHSKYWAVAYGEAAPSFAPALRSGVTCATTRYAYGDDWTLDDYRRVEAQPPGPEAAAFAAAFTALPGARFVCAPVPQVECERATTIGLGDAFVGGFLPALLDH